MAESADALDSGSSRSNPVEVQVLLPASSKEYEKDILPENPDFIGVFAVLGGDFLRIKIVDIKWAFSVCGMV